MGKRAAKVYSRLDIQNADDADLASRAIDLFKKDIGMDVTPKKQKSSSRKTKSAADMVSTKTTSVEPKQEKIWSEKEIAAMSMDEFDKHEVEISEFTTRQNHKTNYKYTGVLSWLNILNRQLILMQTLQTPLVDKLIVFLPSIYSRKVLNFFRKASVVEAINNTDYAGEISAYGDSVKIIKEPVISVSDYTSSDTTAAKLTDQELTLVVDSAKLSNSS